MAQNYNKLIEEAEITREQGKMDKSLALLSEAIIEAGRNNDWDSVLAALGQRIITYLHLYQETGDKNFLELFWADTQGGLKIARRTKASGENKAPLMLRIGQYHGLMGDHLTASSYHTAALNLLPRKKDGRFAEYLGFKGVELALAGNKKGLTDLEEALRIIETDTELRPFHKLVIKSGILLRIAEAKYKFKDKTWNDALDDAFDIAETLSRKHKMKMRLYQAEQLAVKLKRQ
jgi:tetratricopeptide (TPR) repeat protein